MFLQLCLVLSESTVVCVLDEFVLFHRQANNIRIRFFNIDDKSIIKLIVIIALKILLSTLSITNNPQEIQNQTNQVNFLS